MEGFSVNMGIISSLLIKYLGIHHHHRHRHCHSSFTRYFLSTPLSLSLSLSLPFLCLIHFLVLIWNKFWLNKPKEYPFK